MRKLIHSDWFVQQLGTEKIVVLDGGARGALFPPFDTVRPDILHVVKVEPDADATMSSKPNETVLTKAIWSEQTTIPVHIAAEPSVSSVYPPNMQLAARFIDSIGAPARATRKIVQVPATSIDALFREHGLPFPDFIKLDIHGCEYEALSGASEALQKKTVALLIESWVIEAHTGQHLLYKTDELLHRHQFYPVETSTGKWDYKVAEGLVSKPQAVISESLYFREFPHTQTLPDRLQGLKQVAIAELFGHVGYALTLIAFLNEKGVFGNDEAMFLETHIRREHSKSPFDRFVGRIRQKLIRILTDKRTLMP